MSKYTHPGPALACSVTCWLAAFLNSKMHAFVAWFFSREDRKANKEKKLFGDMHGSLYYIARLVRRQQGSDLRTGSGRLLDLKTGVNTFPSHAPADSRARTLGKNEALRMISLLNRVWTSFSPPVAEKYKDAIRFGVLGAAKIA